VACFGFACTWSGGFLWSEKVKMKILCVKGWKGNFLMFYYCYLQCSFLGRHFSYLVIYLSVSLSRSLALSRNYQKIITKWRQTRKFSFRTRIFRNGSSLIISSCLDIGRFLFSPSGWASKPDLKKKKNPNVLKSLGVFYC